MACHRQPDTAGHPAPHARTQRRGRCRLATHRPQRNHAGSARARCHLRRCCLARRALLRMTAVGQNRRYHDTARDLEKWSARQERQPQPVGLTEAGVRASGRRQDARSPIPVTAWVQHQTHYTEALRVEAEAIAWTPNAVLLRWSPTGSPQHTQHAWVYAAAVERRDVRGPRDGKRP